MYRMKIKQVIFSLSLLALSMQTEVFATDVITLRDGSVLEGEITLQHPGKDLTIKAHKATIVAFEDEVENIDVHDILCSELTSVWKNWSILEENASAIQTKDDHKQYLKLGNVSLKKFIPENITTSKDNKENNQHSCVFVSGMTNFSSVRVLERGYKVKFLCLDETNFILKPQDITHIKKGLRAPEAKSGVDDLIETKDGNEYVGQIVEQEYGKSITIDDRGRGYYSIPVSDIKSQKKVKFGEEKAYIAELADYKETIVTNNNRKIEGVITKVVYADKDNEGYVVMQDTQGDPINVKNSDIKEIQREIKIIKQSEEKEKEIVIHDYRETEVKNASAITIHYHMTAPIYCKVENKKTIRFTEENYNNKSCQTDVPIDNIKSGLRIELPKDSKDGDYHFYRLKLVNNKEDNKDVVYSLVSELSPSSKDSEEYSKVYRFKVKKGTYVLVKNDNIAYIINITG